DEMVKIFEHPNMSNETPDGLLKRVFLWVGCCTAQRGGSYYNLMAEHFKERDDGGFDIITIHDKTHQGGYYHRPTSNQTPTHIIPPDESKECGACYDIKKYLNLRPKNAEKNFFLHVNKDPEDIKLGKWYRSQNEIQKLEVAKLTLPGVHKDTEKVSDNIAGYVHEDSDEENINKVDSNNEFHSSSRKTLSEIQNISIPLKRKDKNLELAENFKLKFIKCANITINITKE
ncbi:11577_t:CDS:2, partial [Rhizophagus irregularis]